MGVRLDMVWNGAEGGRRKFPDFSHFESGSPYFKVRSNASLRQERGNFLI